MQISKTQRALSSGRLSGRSALILVLARASGGRWRKLLSAKARVLLHSICPPRSVQSLSAALPSIKVIEGNACDRAAVGRASDACRGVADGLDILVNCVGIFDFYKALGEIDADKLSRGFDEIFRVNVLSGLIAAHTCLPMLRAAKGVVILTASSSGFYPGRGGVLYVSSKFAIRGCVAALANELAPDVRVNGVAPGGVLGTDIRGSRELGLESMRMRADEERIADLEALAPLRMALTAQEIAQSYVFLASDAARGMTGEFLHPDGGLGIRG